MEQPVQRLSSRCFRRRSAPRVISNWRWSTLLKIRTNSSIPNGILISVISFASSEKSSTPPSMARYTCSYSTHYRSFYPNFIIHLSEGEFQIGGQLGCGIYPLRKLMRRYLGNGNEWPKAIASMIKMGTSFSFFSFEGKSYHQWISPAFHLISSLGQVITCKPLVMTWLPPSPS